jgi:spermidine synthase
METIAEISESDACTSYRAVPVWAGKTAMCDVKIAESPVYGHMLFLDGELQSASADEHIYHESLVHPAMAIVHARDPEHPMRVLVVGGGEGATVREVLRWKPAHVDWVDIDGELVNLCREHLRWAPDVYTDTRVQYWPEDIQAAWAHLGRYDVVILDLPDPDGDTGYLYSRNFWRDVCEHLAQGGVVVTHVGPVRPYGGVGEGVKRVANEFDGLDCDGFYQTTIPSFQGAWGFWLYAGDGVDPFHSIRHTGTALPLHLRFIDTKQLRQWMNPTMAWRCALMNALSHSDMLVPKK